MLNLMHLINFEGHKLLMATQPPIKTLLKQKVQKLVTTPNWSEATVIKAMKEIQRDLDYKLKSAPNGKLAAVGLLVVFVVMLKHEIRDINRLVNRPATSAANFRLVNHASQAAIFASMIQGLVKETYSVETESLMAVLRHLR